MTLNDNMRLIEGCVPKGELWFSIPDEGYCVEDIELALEILRERGKQARKYGPDHDDQEHQHGELMHAAAALLYPNDQNLRFAPSWAKALFEKYRFELHKRTVIGCALAMAELSRVHRRNQR